MNYSRSPSGGVSQDSQALSLLSKYRQGSAPGAKRSSAHELLLAIATIAQYPYWYRVVNLVWTCRTRTRTLGRILLYLAGGVPAVGVLRRVVPEIVSQSALGRDGAESLPIETLAGWADTIHYEVATRLGPHLKRTVVD